MDRCLEKVILQLLIGRCDGEKKSKESKSFH